MRLSFFCIQFFVYFAVFGQQQVSLVERIDSLSLKKHLQYLAGDPCEGRGTGQIGYEKAVSYVVEQIKLNGVSPLAISQYDGENTTGYQQKVPLVERKVNRINLMLGQQNLTYGTDFVALRRFNEPSITDEQAVFIGFGIKNQSFDDLNKHNLTNKVVIFYAETPTHWRKKLAKQINNLFNQKEDWDLRVRLANIWAKNPKAVFIVANQSFNLKELGRGFRWSDMQLQQTALEINTQPIIPTIILTETKANEWFKDAKVKPAKMLEALSKKGQTVAQPLPLTCKLDLNQTNRSFTADNVLAYLPGKDTIAELLVISAHLDHLGKDEKGVIYYGADDDGTGSAGLIGLLEVLAPIYQNPLTQPKRGILLLWVTAEEKGLLGSKFYTQFPVLPLSKTIANLNIDMIGRIDDTYKTDPNYIYLIGSDKLSTDLHNISIAANEQSVKLKLDYRYNSETDPNRYYYRSDHYNFVVNGIPAIFYFSGIHADYHQPSDTEEKILYTRMRNVLGLVIETAYQLVNRPARILVDKTD